MLELGLRPHEALHDGRYRLLLIVTLLSARLLLLHRGDQGGQLALSSLDQPSLASRALQLDGDRTLDAGGRDGDCVLGGLCHWGGLGCRGAASLRVKDFE